MLKIASCCEQPGGEVLRLEGRLVGAWVAELQRACEAILCGGGRVSLDLMDVTFIDSDGVALLRELSTRRVPLINCSPFTAELLKADTPSQIDWRRHV